MNQETALAIYLAGVLAGLLGMYEPFPARVVMAMLWPVGPLAFAITVGFLIATSLVIWPWLGVGTLLAGGLLWLVLS